MIEHTDRKYSGINFTYEMFWDDESEAYVVEIVELPGCMATGDTPEAAMRALDEATSAYLDVARLESWNIVR